MVSDERRLIGNKRLTCGFSHPMGGLENRLAGIPRYEGSNPSLSAIMQGKRGPGRFERSAGIAPLSGEVQTDCKHDLGSRD